MKKITCCLCVTLLLILGCTTVIAADIAKSFPTSSKRMFNDVNIGLLNETFYCGCPIMADKQIQRSKCDYVPPRINTRSFSVETEHVVPASTIGSGLQCWGDGRKDIAACHTSKGELLSGRDCCEKVNPVYERAQNDMVNLVPAIAPINLDRRNRPFGMIPGETRNYGQCDVEINAHVIEPRKEVRGDIARIYFYMLYTYGGRLGFDITGDLVSHLYYWDIKDPISAEERIRNERICAAQGSANDLVSKCE